MIILWVIELELCSTKIKAAYWLLLPTVDTVFICSRENLELGTWDLGCGKGNGNKEYPQSQEMTV